jgi:CheY-like chemotaxis protein
MDEPTMQAQDAASSDRRVLIVDDSRDTARLMKVLLKIEGYETRTAYDGPEAIETARTQRPHVVLLDLILPTMGGAEVAAALRSVPELSGCQIVAVSGYDADRIPHPSPFDHHLTKPVDPHHLIQVLAEMTSQGRKTVTHGSVLAAGIIPAERPSAPR